MDLVWASATELAEALDAGEVSSRDITEALIKRAEEVDPKLNAYLERTDDRALSDADAADQRRSKGEARSPYDGVPLGYKDIFVTRGIKTTCGSKILGNFVPPYDATVVTRCDSAGLPMLGKLNMDEFAMGSST